MDRGRGLARLLTAAAAAALVAAGVAEAPSLPIRDSRWTAPGRLWESLAEAPGECFVEPRDPALRRSAAIGRAAFGTPLLLGGQAARAGLSCASCHRNGRGNPHFLFPGLSGEPGTADVTSSLTSARRGDSTPNPKPIPDLAADRPKVKRDRASGALEAFIRGLVVEEFDGPEPPAAVLSGLADYVRALRPDACGSSGDPLAGRLDRVERAVALAASGDRGTRRLLLAAARSMLGEIDERFRLPGLERSRGLIARADSELAALRSGRGDLASWKKTWPARRRALLRDEPRTLFDPDRLRRAINDSFSRRAQAPTS